MHIIANQSSYHDDKSTLQCFIRVFCPHLIRNVRSRRRIDSSSIIAHPVNSDLNTWERSLKCYAKNSTCIYIYMHIMPRTRHTYICIYMMLWILGMDFLYQFNLGLIAPLFSFFSWKVWKKNVFKKFQKLAGLWLVGEVDDHAAIYGSKVAEGFSAFQCRSCCLYFLLVVSKQAICVDSSGTNKSTGLIALRSNRTTQHSSEQLLVWRCYFIWAFITSLQQVFVSQDVKLKSCIMQVCSIWITEHFTVIAWYFATTYHIITSLSPSHIKVGKQGAVSI